MVAQTDYSQDMRVAQIGQRVDARPSDIVSGAPDEVMPFGLVAVQDAVDPEKVRLPAANSVVVTDDGGTFTAGTISATINGVTVSAAFDTDKATSMAALATAIEALAFIASADYAAGSDTITVVAEAGVGIDTLSVDVSGITGDMTIASYAAALSDTVLGLVQKVSREYGAGRRVINDQVLLTLSGDALTTDDTVDGVINGVALGTVTYATSEAATLQAVANEILAVAGVASAVVSGRTILVSNNPGLAMENASLTVTDDTTASVAPTFAATYSSQNIGVANDAVANLPGETAAIVRKGTLYCKAEETLALGASVYVRVQASGANTQRGALRNDADSGTCVLVSSLRLLGPTVTASDGSSIAAPVEINLP